MSLYRCDKCGCADNTALTRYWFRDGGAALCSECDPAIGKWHEQFPKKPWTEERGRPFDQERAGRGAKTGAR